MSGKKTLTIGPVPLRKGKWLGVLEGSRWRALARFRSDEAADEFNRIMILAGVPEAKE